MQRCFETPYGSRTHSTSQAPVQRPVSWNDLHLKPELVRAASELGYQMPSRIQVRAIPKIMQGHHLICQARAGTGKTAVFALGVLHNLSPLNGQLVPHQCIVLAKTRELAYQIMGDFQKLSSHLNNPRVRIGCYYGGTPVQQDCQNLAEPATTPHIIIGTPGRLLDLVERGFINVQRVRYFVVDECDVVVTSGQQGMGFEVECIRRNFRPDVQYILVSATFSPEIKEKCRRMCPRMPTEVILDEGALDLTELTHFFEVVEEKHKFELLEHILDTSAFNQVIIFTNTVQKTVELTEQLFQIMFNPICIHSDLTQEQRINTYGRFKRGESRLLVATDLFGRGIDIEKANLIVNYDCPQRNEDFIHRVGRAGRFGTQGVTITFLTPDSYINDSSLLQQCGRAIKCTFSRLPKDIKPYM